MPSRTHDPTLSATQRALASQVAKEHASRPDVHPQGGMDPARQRLHEMLPVVAETQIAERRPPAAAEALERLIAADVERHRAVHAICTIVAEEVVQVVGKQRAYDEARYVARLEALTPADCVGDEPGLG